MPELENTILEVPVLEGEQLADYLEDLREQKFILTNDLKEYAKNSKAVKLNCEFDKVAEAIIMYKKFVLNEVRNLIQNKKLVIRVRTKYATNKLNYISTLEVMKVVYYHDQNLVEIYLLVVLPDMEGTEEKSSKGLLSFEEFKSIYEMK